MYRGNTKTTFLGEQHGVRSCFMSKADFAFSAFWNSPNSSTIFFIPDVPSRKGVVYDKGYRPQN